MADIHFRKAEVGGDEHVRDGKYSITGSIDVAGQSFADAFFISVATRIVRTDMLLPFSSASLTRSFRFHASNDSMISPGLMSLNPRCRRCIQFESHFTDVVFESFERSDIPRVHDDASRRTRARVFAHDLAVLNIAPGNRADVSDSEHVANNRRRDLFVMSGRSKPSELF